MKKIPFIKMNGAGNDFVFINNDKARVAITPRLARRLLDRHFGVGGDQLLILSTRKQSPRFVLDIYNSDGSKAEMCGNGVRAVATYLTEHQGIKKDFIIKTKAGPIGIEIKKTHIDVDMGTPILEGSKIPVRAKGPIVHHSLRVGSKTYKIHGVSMGNPHCVIYVDRVDRFPVQMVGPLIENHPFFPNRVNVEFVEVLNRTHVKARVWERGAGETLACGTGACAIGVASARFGKTGRDVHIDLPGGRLGVRWASNNHVYLTGPAEVSFEGEFSYV